MTEEKAAASPLSEAMRQVLEERVAKRKRDEGRVRQQAKADEKLVAAIQQRPDRVEHGKISLPEQVARATFMVRRTYLAVLVEPEVVASIRSVLTSGEARAVRDMVCGLKELLAADGVAGGQNAGAVRVTVVNRVPRPAGSPTIDVTPRVSAP